MSLKLRIPARLKSLYSGVALSKKSIEAITEKASNGLTDESTDDEIDAVLNARNEIHSFDDQRKYEDYLAGKASKEAADKEAKRLADIAAGKKPEVELPSDTPEWMKAFMKAQEEKTEALEAKLAAISGEKITTTRREQYAKVLEGKSPEYIASELKKFDKMSFKDDEDFTATLTDFTQEVANAGLGGDRVLGGQGTKPTGTIKVAATEVVDELMNNLN